MSAKIKRWSFLAGALFGLLLWTQPAQAGIPEPGFTMYGVITNSEGAILTSGALAWTIRTTNGGATVFHPAVTNLNNQYSYRFNVPFETTNSLTPLSLTPPAFPLSASSVTYTRSNVTVNGVAAAIRPPASSSFPFSRSLRAKVERVDLYVNLPTGNSTGIQVAGPSAVKSNSEQAYACQAYFAGGWRKEVTALAAWSLVGSIPSGVSLSNHVLRVGAVSAGTEVSLRAIYTSATATYTNTLSVTIIPNQPPVIEIVTPAQPVPYDTTSFAISGTANQYVVGTMRVSNAANGALSTFAASTHWTSPTVTLSVGENRITVYGSNVYGQDASDSVIITRRAPVWWYQRGIILTNQTPNDFAIANLGQVKWVAKKASEEFNAKLTHGAGSNITILVNSFTVSSNNYSAVNLGQLKYIAKPFYDRLWELGLTNLYPPGAGTNQYPWQSSTNAARDYAPANLGQLKYLFSFEVE